MNRFGTDLSRIQVCFIVSIVQREIISISIEMSIEILLFDTHSYTRLALNIFAPSDLRFSNKAYVRIFTTGNFEVLRMYGSQCQRVQYPFWNFAHFCSKFSLFETKLLNSIRLFWIFNAIRIIIVRPDDRFRTQWSIPRKLFKCTLYGIIYTV